jgi:hypothetical protein
VNVNVQLRCAAGDFRALGSSDVVADVKAILSQWDTTIAKGYEGFEALQRDL